MDTRFAEITQFLIGKRVELSEACKIRNDADLIRGNVHDQHLRRLILDHARELKDSRYSHVYIRRDLTFQQREELKSRRAATGPAYGQTRRGDQFQNAHGHQDRYNAPTMPQVPSTYSETVPKRVWNPHAISMPEVGDSQSEVTADSTAAPLA